MRGIFLFSERLCLFLTSVELVHSRSLEKCLLSCIERMTFLAGLDTDFVTFYSASRLESIAT